VGIESNQAEAAAPATRGNPSGPPVTAEDRPVGRARAAALLPDTITSAGLLSGCLSIISGISGNFALAGAMIGVSIVCDVADGLVARGAHVSSQFGLEYDSLSDVVAFGVAPAMVAYAWALRPLGGWAVFVVGAFVICAALRLARYNIQAATPGGKPRFVGLPVPGAAAMIAGSLFGYRYFALDVPGTLCAAMTLVMLALAGLMVSRVPYPNMKGIDLRSAASPRNLIALALMISFFIAAPELAAFAVATGYLLSGPVLLIIERR
jgi:CDP-diacylglycerol--serine O-phosphatidyltransferase